MYMCVDYVIGLLELNTHYHKFESQPTTVHDKFSYRPDIYEIEVNDLQNIAKTFHVVIFTIILIKISNVKDKAGIRPACI